MKLKQNKDYPGTLIVFEGIDGAGKTTVVDIMFKKVQEAFPDREVFRMRTPDGPIRKILLERPYELDADAEALLFAACHADMIASTMKPALERGAIVLCDRFYFSTLSYQGFGRNNLSKVRDLIDGYLTKPDIDYLVFVDAPQNIASKRLDDRGNKDFLDSEAYEFKERTRNGMLSLMEFEARSNPAFTRISNNGTLAALEEMCQHWVSYFLLDIDDRS
jgi:dTMP kinase